MSYTPYGMQPGDHLLYRPSSLFGWIIALKTWTRISHIEIYVGNGQSVAARDGIGVGKFPVRLKHLARVLRPKARLDLEGAEKWFQRVNGQKYDYLGLLVFSLAWRRGALHKQFCSKFATCWDHWAGFWPFSKDYIADRIAPAQFLQSAEFTEVWTDRKYAYRLRH